MTFTYVPTDTHPTRMNVFVGHEHLGTINQTPLALLDDTLCYDPSEGYGWSISQGHVHYIAQENGAFTVNPLFF